MKGFGDLYKSEKKNNKKDKFNNTKIINQAIQLHLEGNISEAEKYYQQIINQGCSDHRVFGNYGVISVGLGRLKEAEKYFRKAIQLNPKYSVAHSNLGNLLRDLGKLNESFDSYLRVIEINPTDSNIYNLITKFLKESDPSKLNKSKLKKILSILIEKNEISHKELINAFNYIYRNKIINVLERFDSEFSILELPTNNKVILNALKKIIFADQELESLLTKVRRNICARIAKDIEKINFTELIFIISLGAQCFLNEYIYSCTEEEKIYINKIKIRCIEGEINEANISILSCYFPLFKLLDEIPSLKSFTSSNQNLRELVELQLKEPIKEIELSKKIKKLGSINNDISKKVKSQYEVNPYPRWRYTYNYENQKISILELINNEIKPNIITYGNDNDQLEILIAGCGTGNQILESQRYRNAKIVGIDLSLSSLAYARRKIYELGIDNVELIQMDILEVALLEMKFDIVECSGVLHHMNNPSQGLRALLGVLKKNGFLKLGLYSEIARKDIIKAREYIIKKNLQPNDESIRNFRKDVFSCKIEGISNLINWVDFYTMSECRDLCFHIQEQRFTLKQIQETLKSNKLEFLGFLLPKTVKSLYGNDFPEDITQTNLQNWARFEERHPNTFREMYQFWVSKI